MVVAAALAPFGFIAAGPFLRTHRFVAGRANFWLGLFLLSIGMGWLVHPFWGLCLLMAGLLIGIQAEMEVAGRGLFASGMVAILAASVVGVAGFWHWASGIGRMEAQLMLSRVTEHLQVQMKPSANLPADWLQTLLWQTPAVVVSLLIITLAVALMFERLTLKAMGSRSPCRYLLNQFSLPDACVWVAIVSMLLSFLDSVPKWLNIAGTNVLLVIAVLYFLQGLAVLQHVYRALRMGRFWRWLFTIVICLQIPWVLSVVGLADFWMNFRHRLSKSKRLSKAYKQGE